MNAPRSDERGVEVATGDNGGGGGGKLIRLRTGRGVEAAASEASMRLKPVRLLSDGDCVEASTCLRLVGCFGLKRRCAASFKEPRSTPTTASW